jgi:hypothetical protein
VLSTWHQTWFRVTRMSRNELLTRARQHMGKRFDLALYNAGFLGKVTSWTNMKPAAGGAFFFSAEDVASLAGLLHQHLPDEVAQIFREAEAVCAHRFQLLAYGALNYGSEIDWHLDAVHSKRAQLTPGFKVRFLEFSEVGDHKVTWELNRHQHLVTLAKAWALSRDRRYATELIKQWYGWRRANPFPMGINWASSLEVSFRSMSWLWVRFLLAEYPPAPANFESDLLQALALSGNYIERNLSTYFSPNTHLLGEAVGLFFIGTLCPQIPAAGRWKNRGWHTVLQEAQRQIRSDGSHFEQALYYHVYALDLFLHTRILAARNGMEIPSGFDATLGRMLDFLQSVSQAGPPDSWGDDDGGRVFDHTRNRSEHLTDPLAIGAVLFQRDDLRSAVSLTEEALWLFGQKAISCFAAPSGRPHLKAASFEEAGIYVVTSSQPRAQRMLIDAGPQGVGRAGHGHADALSVTVSFDGRRWLIDPGTYCYVSTDTNKERDRFRGTGAHNTLRVDGLDQAIPDGPFSWSSLPQVQVEQWITGKHFSLFAGRQNGYSRLPDPVLHWRFIFHLHGVFWLVRDVAEGRERHYIETSWHFASDVEVHDAQGSFVASASRPERDHEPRLALVPAQDSGWTFELSWDEVSPAYGIKHPAPMVRIGAHVELPAEHATLISPLLHPSDEPGRLSRLNEPRHDRICGYRYDGSDSTHFMIFSSDHEKWALGPFVSDAEFLFCRLQDGEIAQFILCNGSFASLRGKTVFTHVRKVARLEWLDQSGVSASDGEAALSLSEDLLRSATAF